MLIPLLAFVPFATAETLHVPAEHPTIQEAINAASDGDLVLVAPGNYIERLNAKGKAITIQGEAGAESTIIDATGKGRSPALECSSNETAKTRIVDLTLTGGKGAMNMGWGEVMGGGALVVEASPTFLRCIFRENFAQYGSGGGAAITGGSPIFINCSFQENTAEYIGGAVYVHRAMPQFFNCSFTGNKAYTGGGIYLWKESGSTFESCRFENNTAATWGGAIFNWQSSALFTSCSFKGNIAKGGRAIYNLTSTSITPGCTFGDDQDVAGNTDESGLKRP